MAGKKKKKVPHSPSPDSYLYSEIALLYGDLIKFSDVHDEIIKHIKDEKDIPFNLVKSFLSYIKIADEVRQLTIERKVHDIHKDVFNYFHSCSRYKDEKKNYDFTIKQPFELPPGLNSINTELHEERTTVEVEYSLSQMLLYVIGEFLKVDAQKKFTDKDETLRFFFQAINQYCSSFINEPSSIMTRFKRAVVAGYLTHNIAGLHLTEKAKLSNSDYYTNSRNALKRIMP